MLKQNYGLNYLTVNFNIGIEYYVDLIIPVCIFNKIGTLILESFQDTNRSDTICIDDNNTSSAFMIHSGSYAIVTIDDMNPLTANVINEHT